jgi:hypothetical protein
MGVMIESIFTKSSKKYLIPDQRLSQYGVSTDNMCGLGKETVVMKNWQLLKI